MSRVFAIVITCFIGIAYLSGCSDAPPANPEPELTDAIYMDLQKQKGSVEKFFKVAEKTLELTLQDMRDAQPQTGQYQRKRKQYFNELRSVRKMRQEMQYLDFRIMSRAIYVRKQYAKARKEGKPWPDPNEYKRYMASKKLKEASRRWDDRVPKLDDRIENHGKPAKKKK